MHWLYDVTNLPQRCHGVACLLGYHEVRLIFNLMNVLGSTGKIFKSHADTNNKGISMTRRCFASIEQVIKLLNLLLHMKIIRDLDKLKITQVY